MKTHHLGFLYSLLIHAGIFLLGIFFVHTMQARAAANMRSIDFSLVELQPQIEEPTPPKPAPKPEKLPPVPPPPPKVKPKPKPVPVVKDPEPPAEPKAGIASQQESETIVQGEAATVAEKEEPAPEPAPARPPAPSNGIITLAQGTIDYTHIRSEILRQISYPVRARRMGIEGRTVVSFIILENGFTTNIKIVQSSGSRLLDNYTRSRIERTIISRNMPYKVQVTIPIVYALQS